MLKNQKLNQKETANNLKYKNSRLIGNCNSTNSSSNISSSELSDYIDEDYSDYVTKNDIPEMKLLQMDYIQKTKPQPPNKCKCAGDSKSVGKLTISAPEPIDNSAKGGVAKYLVYKRKHSIFGTASEASADGKMEKLKYVSDNKKSGSACNQEAPKSSKDSNRKKYLIFDSKKNSSASKLDTIQYYFDNKSYEKYVDNKLYGVVGQKQQQQQQKTIDDESNMKGFEKAKSWEYRDNTKTDNKLKLFESKLNQEKPNWKSKSEGSTSGASSCESSSDISLKRRNCRLKPQQKFTTSKSISDLSIRTNQHDVSRINQLFANAKNHQANGGNFDKEKYKIHRKLNEYNVDIGNGAVMPDNIDEKLLTKDNLRKYHRSSTELNMKLSSPSQSSSCGYKNCKFSNCPISTNSSSGSDRSSTKFDTEFIKKFEEMRKSPSKLFKNLNNNNNINNINNNNVNNNNNKTNISVNGKSNIIVNDTKNLNDHYEYPKDHVNQNNINNINNSNKTTIKINESCFVVNHTNNMGMKNNETNRNVIKLNSERIITAPAWDKNMKLKNNPPKYDNKIDVNNKIRNEENSVKIYVSGNDSSIKSTTLSSTSSMDSSDSDKDYGYFDTSSQGRSSSPEFAQMFKQFRQFCNINSKQLGCDGTMFWNNSYFDDEDATDMTQSIARKAEKQAASLACTKCHTTQEDIMSNYICICRNKKVII